MEAAYDKNNSNSAFDNDASHFKFSNTDGGFNISPDMPVSNDSEEHQMISPPSLVKKCYDESNEVQITDEAMDVVDNHPRFEDDFGPETDVDATDDTNFTKSPIDPQTNENNNEYSLSNGIKPFSLENKIIQQLSEQNRDFLTDSNPFQNDHFDQYRDDEATKVADDSSSEVVDNKIIDALESLAGENEKLEYEGEKQESDLPDIRQHSPDIPDSTEKTDYVHEKTFFLEDSAAKLDNSYMPHSDSSSTQAEILKSSLIEKEDTPSTPDTKCVDESVGEESEEEEEEDEWNYIKGDKKSEEKLIPSDAEFVVDPAHSSGIQSSESVLESVDTNVSNSTPEPQLLDLSSGETVPKDEEILGEKIDETKDGFPESEDCIIKTEDRVSDTLAEHSRNIAVSIEQELADYANTFPTVASGEVESSFANSVPVQYHEELSLGTAPNLLLETPSALEPAAEYAPFSEIVTVKEQPSTEIVVSDKPFTDIATEESQSTDIVTEESSSTDIVTEEVPPVVEDTSSMNIAKEDTPCTEIVLEDQQTTEGQSSEIVRKTSVDEELERPDSLSFEMASKLNPEAKEFVPVSSPNRSNPTSPVGNAPSMVPNSFLMLDDDTVVAQSPKKFTTTMDNIDVPAEDDFQNEMNNRPHELEKPSEYINGNADLSVRSHSPVSEPSSQELNLKEAMQADEKLEHDYNDEKQILPEDSPSDDPNEQNLSNLLNRDQNPMNMSFYEGRDEGLLSNSDELNKVHMLPEDDDETEEQPNDDIDKVHIDMNELIPIDSKEKHQLDDRMDITEPEEHTQSAYEEDMQVKCSASEEPPATIYAVASQVVNDVAALVDQMQIEPPIATETDLEHEKRDHLEELIGTPTENTSIETKMEETGDILVSLERQNETKPLEDAIDIGQHIESPSPNPADNVHTAETEELVAPLVECSQQEMITENEFITDESVLNVQSPSKSMFLAESPLEPESVLDEFKSSKIETVAEKAETSTIPNLLDTVPPVLEQAAAAPVVDTGVDQLKAVVAGTKSTTTKPSGKSPATARPTTPKTTSVKSSKPAAPSVERKTTVGKVSAKPTTTKPTATLKPSSTSTVKRTSTVTSASSTRTSSAAKPPSASATGRSSTAGSATSKLSSEKKAPLTVKKPATTAINGDVKATSVAKKSTATALKPTTVTKTSTPSIGSATNTRVSSTSVRSITAKSSTTTTKSTTSAPAKPSTTVTARPNVPTAKPRTVPSTASKTASSTVSTTTVTSKPSSNITKRTSTVGTAASKTTAAVATTKMAGGVKTTNSVANRTSTVSKTSSTTATGIRKVAATSPSKKPVSSPATKTNPSSTKAAASPKNAVSNNANGKVGTEVAKSTDLDLDKQFKNDNNQLITNNGIESPMMVIDSAAD